MLVRRQCWLRGNYLGFFVNDKILSDPDRFNAGVLQVMTKRFAILGGGKPPVADGWTLHAIVDRATLRPTRVPPWLHRAIEQTEARS